MIHAAIILLTAFVLDFLWGDPPYRFHPIRLLGTSISILEKILRTLGLSALLGGMLLVTFVLGFTVAIYVTAHWFLAGLHPWLATILDIYLLYSCLALTDLLLHAMPVAMALERDDIVTARSALQRIVGRDTSGLDSVGVARGAVESVAENFVDGVLSPMFWYTSVAVLSHLSGCPSPTAAGIGAMLGFKAISTLDSMVGYRRDPYLLFGRPAARLDDLANFLPARLSLIILYLGAVFSGEKAWAGWKIALRDRLKHSSPNAGHPESFVAGVLGIKLGGPTVYQEKTVEKPWLGDGETQVGPQHIRRCCRLVYLASWVAVLLVTAGLVICSIVFS